MPPHMPLRQPMQVCVRACSRKLRPASGGAPHAGVHGPALQAGRRAGSGGAREGGMRRGMVRGRGGQGSWRLGVRAQTPSMCMRLTAGGGMRRAGRGVARARPREPRSHRLGWRPPERPSRRARLVSSARCSTCEQRLDTHYNISLTNTVGGAWWLGRSSAVRCGGCETECG